MGQIGFQASLQSAIGRRVTAFLRGMSAGAGPVKRPFTVLVVNARAPGGASLWRLNEASPEAAAQEAQAQIANEIACREHGCSADDPRLAALSFDEMIRFGPVHVYEGHHRTVRWLSPVHVEGC